LANPDFWNDDNALPPDVRTRADKQLALLRTNPQHPSSLTEENRQLKKIGERRGEEICSARVTLKYRALAIRLADEYLWLSAQQL